MTEDTSRRTFVGSMLAGIPAFTLTPLAQEPQFPLPDVSAADSLVVYIDMLRGVQNEVLQRSAGKWQAAYSGLSQRVKTIRTMVEQLAAEIGKKDQVAAAHLLALAATGRSLETALASGQTGDLRSSHGLLVGRFAEACRTCPDVVEAQDTVLSARGRQLIADLVTAVRDLEEQSTTTDAASLAFKEGFARIQTDLDDVRDLFLRAASSIAAALDSRTLPDAAQRRRDDALQDLEGSRSRLAALETAHKLDPGPLFKRDALRDLIKGTIDWLTTPPAPRVASLVPMAVEDSQALVRTADQRARLWDLLNKHSPTATLLREIYLRALVTPIWVGYSDRVTRERLIREVLTVFPSNPPAWASAEFVSALATFV
jgi:hypothetical protein